MKFTIVEKLPRSVLGEGRSQGMGHGFCKREGDTYTTVNPVSPCKDYLNDVVYTERSGRSFSACGLNTTKQGIFADKCGYLLTRICGYGSRENRVYNGMEKDIADLEANYKNAEKALRLFEQELKIDQRTEIHRVDANLFMILVPDFWCQYTYTISLYTLLVRNLVRWNGKGSPKDFLMNLTTGDVYMMKPALAKLDKMIAGVRPVQDWDKMMGNVHGNGIFCFPFPTT